MEEAEKEMVGAARVKAETETATATAGQQEEPALDFEEGGSPLADD